MAARRTVVVLVWLAAAVLAGSTARSEPAVPDVFALRLLNLEALIGSVFRAWVQVYNPYDQRPLPGVGAGGSDGGGVQSRRPGDPAVTCASPTPSPRSRP